MGMDKNCLKCYDIVAFFLILPVLVGAVVAGYCRALFHRAQLDLAGIHARYVSLFYF